MRPILSATQTYNYALAKWLEDKLKPLSYNKYTVSDTFQFVNEIQGLKINNGELLVSYYATSLFTNLPLNETIQILADKAFADGWFNKTTKLNLTKEDLVDLLKAATKNQLFQFDASLYEQIDGVAMGLPLGPLLANVSMCSIEETLRQDGLLPPFYRRYVDDTLTIMPDRVTADHFLCTLNYCHSSVKFTMETEHDGSLPFLGVELLNRAPKIETKVYIKPTNTGRAYRLSSDWSQFHEECDRLREVFSKLKYPQHFIDTAIKKVIDTKVSDPQPHPSSQEKANTVRVILPFKDQSSANIVKQQLSKLSLKVGTAIQPVFVSRKLNEDLKVQEANLFIVSQQRVVYKFKCTCAMQDMWGIRVGTCMSA